VRNIEASHGQNLPVLSNMDENQGRLSMPNKNIMNTFLSITCLLTLATACTSGGGGGTDDNPQNTQGTPGQPTPTPVATAVPTPPPPTPTPRPTGTPGTFKPSTEITEAQTAQFYNTGCKVAGKPESKKMIDPRLRLGMTFVDSMVFADPDVAYKMKLSSKIVGLTSTTSRTETKILETNIPETQVGQVSHTNCEVVSEEEGDCQGESSVNLPAVAIYVFAPNPLAPTEKKFETGWYFLDDGYGIPAWRSTVFNIGWILDPMGFKIIGEGTQTVTNIYAPELPVTGVEICGGAQVVNDTLVQAKDGMRVNQFGGRTHAYKAK
jgi:hypothetical protein